MAVTATTIASWSELATFLDGVRDKSNNKFFANTVTYGSNKISLNDSDNHAFCELCDLNNTTSVKVKNASNNQTFVISYSTVTFPITAYKSPNGCAIVFGDVDFPPLMFCKTNRGKTAAIICKSLSGVSDYYSLFLQNIVAFTYEVGYISTYATFPVMQIGAADNNNYIPTDMGFTSFYPLAIIGGANPDYTIGAYFCVTAQQAQPTYGVCSQDGHTYLTNGIFALLDS